MDTESTDPEHSEDIQIDDDDDEEEPITAKKVTKIVLSILSFLMFWNSFDSGT